jgi:hypothetical protein
MFQWLLRSYTARRKGRDISIIVGAINPIGRDPVAYTQNASNYGDRLDLSAWGTSVVTTGYYNLANGLRDLYCCNTSQNHTNPTDDPADPRQNYTSNFSGTSAAAPIVSGAAAIVQAVQKQRYGVPFTPRKVRQLLRAYGTPQAATSNQFYVGPMPNLKRVLERMDLAYDWRYDVDGDGDYSPYTDGLMILRYLFGNRGDALIGGALGRDATRTTVPAIEVFLAGLFAANEFDIDDNGSQDALTDGTLLIRWMFGLQGTHLTNMAIGNGAKRMAANDIAAFIEVHSYKDRTGNFVAPFIKLPFSRVAPAIDILLLGH